MPIFCNKVLDDTSIVLVKVIGMRQARTIRKLRKKSLKETAEGTSIDMTALSRFERGERDMRVPNLIRLADYLDTSIDELLRDEREVVPVG